MDRHRPRLFGALHPSTLRLIQGLVGIVAALSLHACQAAESNDRAGREPAAAGDETGPGQGFDPTPEDFARMGEGFVVWESNRTGDWRLWTRRLDGTGLAQLTVDEGDRQHCCPHISPDGAWVAYLSVGPEARHQYPETGLHGELRLLASDGSVARALAAEARGYGDHRAVVWRNEHELVYIDGEGRTRLLDLEAGSDRVLVEGGLPRDGWLVDASLRWAATAGLGPIFAPFDPDRGTVATRSPLGGCAPYFTHDGLWGFWGAGTGGPVNRFDLATGRASIILARNDPRMPAGHGYLYFPMISRDTTLFAVGASPDEHDHFRANYDIYVAELDPRTLEIVSTPLRYTTHPATDRYPDVWRAPLPLGRHSGKAPLRVTLEAEGSGPWEWDLGDGTRARGARVEHTYPTPGNYPVTAAHGERSLAGLVTVDPPAPPEIVAAELRRAGTQVLVRFGEPVEVAGAEAAMASGLEVAAVEPGEDGRSLVLSLAQRLERGDRVILSGVSDRAQSPNLLPRTEVELEPPGWPSRRDGLLFLWESAAHPNLVFDRRIEADRAVVLEARGRARYDRNHAMVLGSGAFTADEQAAGYVRFGAEATNTVSFEAVVTPRGNGGGGPAWIVSFGRGPGERNFALGQVGERLVLRLRTPSTGDDAGNPELDLGLVPAGAPSHVAVTYLPGRLAAYVDGELRLETDQIRGGLTRWRRLPLLFGDDPGGGAGWRGTLEGVAFYDRFLEPEEVRENALRYRERITARAEVPRLRVEGRLAAVSEPPTVRQITPYRKGLMVHELAVERVLEGRFEGERLRVARWAIQDGRRLPIADARPGERLTLSVEPFAANPQLQPLFVADTLPPNRDLALYYEVDE